MFEPYINLAEKLGSFISQLSEGGIKSIDIQYCGQINKHDVSPLTMAAVKGVLTPIMQETVNFINALSAAKERGIKVQEAKVDNDEEFANLITIVLKTDKGSFSVAGTLFTDKQPRIVKINDFYIEALPQGYMIVAHNLDKPGIIGAVGTLLGNNNINIAEMTFGREERGGRAISALNIDSEVSPELLDKLKKLKNILDAKLIKV
jgi:D-3-phosphoglycerate dehydrogenase